MVLFPTKDMLPDVVRVEPQTKSPEVWPARLAPVSVPVRANDPLPEFVRPTVPKISMPSLLGDVPLMARLPLVLVTPTDPARYVAQPVFDVPAIVTLPLVVSVVAVSSAPCPDVLAPDRANEPVPLLVAELAPVMERPAPDVLAPEMDKPLALAVAIDVPFRLTPAAVVEVP